MSARGVEWTGAVMTDRLKAAEAVALLNGLGTGERDDPEADHSEADRILLLAVPESVRAAYASLVERSKWWATA